MRVRAVLAVVALCLCAVALYLYVEGGTRAVLCLVPFLAFVVLCLCAAAFTDAAASIGARATHRLNQAARAVVAAFATLTPTMRVRGGLAVVALCLCAAAFYWYSWRPTSIRRSCSHSAMLEIREVYPSASDFLAIENGTYKPLYEHCLHEHGLDH
jgi:hypothetical protein